MSRLFTFSSVRKPARISRSITSDRSFTGLAYGASSSIGLLTRSLRHYAHNYRGQGDYLRAYDARGCTYSHFSRNFSAFSATNKATYHAHHLTWKRLLVKCRNGGRSFPYVDRIAQAVSLALTRSPLVISGILAITGGQIAWAQRMPADSYYYPSQNALYMRAQSGHAFVNSLVFSLYDVIVLLLRAAYLAILFFPSIIMAPFADSFGVQFRKVWLQVVHRSLELAGPAFIKWGQWAATRPDLFPRDLCAKLSELHTKAPEHSFSYTRKSIEAAFGRKLSEIFEHFEEVPVASGSIAQVHRASLKFRYPGQQVKPMTVAVKVRHPGVGESIRRDFAIINFIARISNFLPTLRWLRLDESVQQFAVFMMSQVDLAREAAHLSRFIYNFRRWKDVSFPKPVYPLVHPAVLVETYEQGECVSRYVDELEGHSRLKSALAHIGTHALLKMLLVDNFIHADMHPGNILVRVAKSDSSRKKLFKSKPHVVFLDVGMTAELSKSDRVNLLEFFKAVARRDGKTAAECTLRLSKQQNCPNPEAFIKVGLSMNFIKKCEHSEMFVVPHSRMSGGATVEKELKCCHEVDGVFSFWGTAEGDKIHPADCMQDLLERVRRHRVNIDGNVCTVMVTTLVLEGWQRKLDPGYDVMHTLQTLLLRADWAKSLSYTIDGLMAP